MNTEDTHPHNDDKPAMRRWLHKAGHFLAHDHDHAPATELLDTGEIGIRATKLSLVMLGFTALIQAIVVFLSGSVALLSDTLHNLTDALTAIPLWIAFALGRRPASRRYTYGLHRTEDLVGFGIVMVIAVSAVLVITESIQRLGDPRDMTHIPWVIGAGVVGGIGNELVARYRMRVGESIGSEALITDGRHARTDALTSIAVVAAGIGAVFEASWVDPVAGLVVAVPIVWLLVRSARRMLVRLVDGIDPEIVDEIASVMQQVDGVDGVGVLRARWHGHQLRVTASITVDPELTVRQGHDIAHEVEHELRHRFTSPVVVVIHVEPRDDPDRHDRVSHHGHT